MAMKLALFMFDNFLPYTAGHRTRHIAVFIRLKRDQEIGHLSPAAQEKIFYIN
ncbi:hypothetical protein BZL35_00538 [Candidatus Pandoraea novymonadis]|uniref:Uncharacterized protein n=1 Tax=Candidatus Pandoraea novymonadis TaxID=1808959 RepID=A0ABX5FF22_9BURK|nr:hypothetical protein BZL35_00538 [Candidatus Pandoraea novymonadis]